MLAESSSLRRDRCSRVLLIRWWRRVPRCSSVLRERTARDKALRLALSSTSIVWQPEGACDKPGDCNPVSHVRQPPAQNHGERWEHQSLCRYLFSCILSTLCVCSRCAMSDITALFLLGRNSDAHYEYTSTAHAADIVVVFVAGHSSQG